MSSSLSQAGKRAKNRVFLRIFLAGVSVTLLSKLSAFVLQHWDVPFWLRVLLALCPLLPFLVVAMLPRLPVIADELDLRINQESVVFAFYGFFVVLLATTFLREGGVLIAFEWKSERLLTVLLGLLVLGHFKALRRYR